jgi:hypothetical protein
LTARSKGRAERAIGYLRTSFFPAVRFSDLDDLNLQAERFCTEVASLRRWPQQREIRVVDAFAKERAALVPLPGDPFPAEEVVVAAAGRTPYVRFDSNRYSVRHDRVQRQLTVRASSLLVRVFDRNEVVAEHRRCWAKHRVVEDPEHVADLVSAKRQARRQRGQDRLLRAVPRCETLLSEMAKRQRRLGSAVDWLNRLLDQFGRPEMVAAVDEALAAGSPSVETVQLILDRRRRARRLSPAIPVALPDRPEVRNLTVIPHDLADYDPEGVDHD